METTTEIVASPKYWLSLEQWRQDPEFQKMAESEFQSSPLSNEDGQGGWARREFMKLMGASLALTTFGCVRRPAQQIIPYAKRPEEVIPGLPNHYASSAQDGLEGIGILVTTREGRPIKIEGNADHGANEGGMSARAHAQILKLYDPDRLNGPKRNLQNEKRTNRETINIAWDALDKNIVEELKKGKVAILTHATLSPSTASLLKEFAGAFGARLYMHEDLSYESLRQAQRAAFGTENIPVHRPDKARMIVSVNNDFLGTWLTPIRYQKQFATGRKADANMSELVVFESLMSMTGSNADRRFRIRPSQSLDVIMGLLHELIVVQNVTRFAGDASVRRVLSAFAKTQGELGFSLAPVASRLWQNRGKSLVLAGGGASETSHSVQLQIAAAFLNLALENEGQTVYSGGVDNELRGAGNMAELMGDLKADRVQTLLIYGCNPVYSMPTSAGWVDLAKMANTIVYFGDRNDETGKLADYVATDHHPLENWGDIKTIDGHLSLQQPTITPLYNTRAAQDSWMAWMKLAGRGSAQVRGSDTWYDYLKSKWRDLGSGASWETNLQKGVAAKASRPSTRPFNRDAFMQIQPVGTQSGMELAIYSTIGLGDSQLANVPWMQEFPDPVTKICWDNYACFSPADAAGLHLNEGSHVELKVEGQKLVVPAHIQPGQADGTVGLAFGWGRNGAGRVADGIGVSAMQLAKWDRSRSIGAGLQVEVQVIKKGHTDLACVQGHHTMEGRQIVVEETLDAHIKSPGGAVHRHKITTMWKPHEYTKNNKWGMVVDLNSCTGCGACIIACQSENSIPTVGKKYVLKGREMHWMRIDRYYAGDPGDPRVVNQPVLCMHCDNAPCETVCPVIATVHSDEGTNDMIYNRCVGTRYCSNNCPYKVRRFNWFDYTEIVVPREMALNPEVGVRHRGVMEKCTFCLHRIRGVKAQLKNMGQTLKDGDVVTACQQSCPTKAIVFGDLNDPKSQVMARFSQPSTYSLLEELNTQTAVRYNVKVRNAPELPGGGKHHEEGHHA